MFAADGTLVAQADFIPAQLGAMSLVVGTTLERWGEGIAAGDVFVSNHPYLGAMHTPDVNILQPVFVDGRLFAWTGATAHHLDVGGVNPGTEGPDLRELYAEGVVLPPIRLYRGGADNRDVFDLLTENVRDPRSRSRPPRAARGVRSRRAASARAARALRPATVQAGFRRSVDVVERATRERLREAPDGTADAEGFLDDDGRGGPPTRLHARLDKRGDRLTVDLSGSARRSPGRSTSRGRARARASSTRSAR